MTRGNPVNAITALFLTIILVLTTSAVACALDSTPFKFTKEVVKGTLENGLTYLVRENGRPEQRAKFYLIVNAGTVQESDHGRGAAHFVEHMAFNGTGKFPGKEIESYMESIGMGKCDCLGGTTGKEETTYWLGLPTDIEGALNTGMTILSEIASNISFDPEEVEKERGVLVEEWRGKMGNDMSNSLKVRRFMYDNSRFADRLPSEERSNEGVLKREDLLAYYRDWYRPDLMAVVAVGDFEADDVVVMIRKHFGPISMRDDVPERVHVKAPKHEGLRYLNIADHDIYVEAVSIIRFEDAPPRRNTDELVNSMALSAFNILMNQRFAERSLDPSCPYRSVGVDYSREFRDVASASLSVVSMPGESKPAMDAALQEVARVVRDGFTVEEFDRLKKAWQSRNDQYARTENERGSSSMASELKRHYLYDEQVFDTGMESEVKGEAYAALTLEAVNAYAERALDLSGASIVVMSPEGGEGDLPGKTWIADRIANMDSIEVESYVDETDYGLLLEEKPEPGTVVREELIESFGAVRWELSNGMRVYIRQNDYHKHKVQFAAYSPGGHSLASDEMYPSALMASTLVLSGGAGRFDALSLGKKLSGLNVSVMPYIVELEEGLSGQASLIDLEHMFQLVYLYFTSPRKDEKMFDLIMQRGIESLELTARQPEQAFINAVSETYHDNHLRRKPFDREMLEKVDLDKAVDFYRTRFSDAGAFTFIFVGDASPEDLKPMVTRYLASLPSGKRAEGWKDVGVRMPKGVVKRDVTTGLGDKATVSILLHGTPRKTGREEKLAMRIMSKVLSDRLNETLREDDSATYGVSVSHSLEKDPRKEYSVSVSFTCAPGMVDTLANEAFAVMEGMKELEGLEEDVEGVIEKYLTSYENSRKTNSYWMTMLRGLSKGEFKAEKFRYFDKIVKEVDARTIRSAARRYLNPKNYIRIVYYHDS